MRAGPQRRAAGVPSMHVRGANVRGGRVWIGGVTGACALCRTVVRARSIHRVTSRRHPPGRCFDDGDAGRAHAASASSRRPARRWLAPRHATPQDVSPFGISSGGEGRGGKERGCVCCVCASVSAMDAPTPCMDALPPYVLAELVRRLPLDDVVRAALPPGAVGRGARRGAARGGGARRPARRVRPEHGPASPAGPDGVHGVPVAGRTSLRGAAGVPRRRADRRGGVRRRHGPAPPLGNHGGGRARH